jgi:hypothetical protein
MNYHRLLLFVALVLAVMTLAPGEAQAITGQGIGVRAGWVFDYDQPILDDEGISPSDLSMYGAHITVLSISKLSVEASLEYASKDYLKEIIGTAPGGIDATVVDVGFKVRDYAVFLTGRYKLIQGNFGVHLGGGLNFHRMTYSMDLPDILSWVSDEVQLPDNGWHSGMHGLAGVSLGLPMLPFRAFGEVRVAKISVEGKAGMQATLLAGATFGAF